MPEDKIESELKSEIARHKPRDEEGHFVHVEPPQSPKPPQNPIEKLFSHNVHYSKNQDDLLDVHIGNPLRRITKLLEDIKKQKAFSFTLKGSLGIMGVFLALSVFGIFGGGKILCDKGVQTEIGRVKTLQVMDANPSTIPVLSLIIDYFAPKSLHNRHVLIRDDQNVIRLLYSHNVDITQYANYPVIVTGDYDACAQIITVTNPSAVEIYVESGE